MPSVGKRKLPGVGKRKLPGAPVRRIGTPVPFGDPMRDRPLEMEWQQLQREASSQTPRPSPQQSQSMWPSDAPGFAQSPLGLQQMNQQSNQAMANAQRAGNPMFWAMQNIRPGTSMSPGTMSLGLQNASNMFAGGWGQGIRGDMQGDLFNLNDQLAAQMMQSGTKVKKMGLAQNMMGMFGLG